MVPPDHSWPDRAQPDPSRSAARPAALLPAEVSAEDIKPADANGGDVRPADASPADRSPLHCSPSPSTPASSAAQASDADWRAAFRRSAFATLVAALDEAGLAYCLLAGHDDHPHHLGSDIDFMVLPADLPRLPALLQQVAQRCGALLVQHIRHEPGACWFVLARRAGAQLACLQPDACGDYRRGGRVWLRAATVLAQRQRQGGALVVAAPAHAYAYYLIKKIDKGVLDARHARLLSERHALDRVACGRMTRRLLPAPAARTVNAAACRADWHAVQADLEGLRRVLRQQQHGTGLLQGLGNRLAFWATRGRRVLQPTGFWIVVLGPDGSGKSTLIDALAAELAPLFRLVVRRHLRWPVLPPRRTTAGAGEDARHAQAPHAQAPHAQAPRGRLASLAKLGHFWLDQWLAAWLRVWPCRVRSGLVIFDRHYHDLLADPRRYRYHGPLWLARLLGFALPRADLVLVLDAPVAVLQGRKAEVTPAASAAQRRAYLALADTLAHVRLLDASLPAQQVQAMALQRVLEVLETRCQQRLGLPATLAATAAPGRPVAHG